MRRNEDLEQSLGRHIGSGVAMIVDDVERMVKGLDMASGSEELGDLFLDVLMEQLGETRGRRS